MMNDEFMITFINNDSKRREHRLLLASFAIIIDVLICMGLGVVKIFFYYLVFGLSKKNLLLYGPSVATEVAVQQVFFFPCMTGYPKIKEWCSRQNRYVVFAAYFSFQLACAFISIFIQCVIQDFVWYTRSDSSGNVIFTQPAYGGAIGMHQLITFVLTTCHSILANYHFFKDMDPFAAGVCAEIITWFVWGIWVGDAISPLSNLNQIGGYIQWIPLVNLMNHGIFKKADFSFFKNDLSKFGVTFALIQIPCLICYVLSALFDYYVIIKPYVSGGDRDPHLAGHHIWSMAALSWLPFQITGTRLAPIFYDKFCKTSDGKNRWVRMFLWVVIFIGLCVPLVAAFYAYYQMFLYDFLMVKVLKCTDHLGNPLKTNLESWPLRPAYFFGFGVGIIYAAWFDCYNLSKSSKVFVEARISVNRLSSRATPISNCQELVLESSQVHSSHIETVL